MNPLDNCRVYHKDENGKEEYGEGMIISAEPGYIYVKFVSDNSEVFFESPISFNNGLLRATSYSLEETLKIIEQYTNQEETTRINKTSESGQDKVVSKGSASIIDALKVHGVEKLYHISHINNLPGIIEDGLLSRNILERKGKCFTDKADAGIVNTRKYKTDTIYKRALNSYVPLFINPRGPMLYRITNAGAENEIVIIEIDPVVLEHRKYVFTDGNAASQESKFYRYPESINRLDWECLKANSWDDENPDEKARKVRTRAAEFMIQDCIPKRYLVGIRCCSEQSKNKAVIKISNTYSRISVTTNSGLFF